MVKIIGDKTWRFFSDNSPYRLEAFNRAGKKELVLQPEILHNRLAGLFQIPADKISAAVAYIQSTPLHISAVPICISSRA